VPRNVGIRGFAEELQRGIDEDKGWLALGDLIDAVASTAALRDSDATLRQKIADKFRERRFEELRKWGHVPDGDAASLARAEARAEAASTPDRIVPVASLGMRRWRTDFVEPLLAPPVGAKKKKSRASGSANGKSAAPKGRLARAVRVLTEDTDVSTLEERRALATIVHDSLPDCGVRMDHPVRKKLARFIAQPLSGS